MGFLTGLSQIGIFLVLRWCRYLWYTCFIVDGCREGGCRAGVSSWCGLWSGYVIIRVDLQSVALEWT